MKRIFKDSFPVPFFLQFFRGKTQKQEKNFKTSS